MVEYLSRREAAEYLKERGTPIAWTTLTKLACIGGGPRYRIWGNKAVYSPADLDEWRDAKLSPPRTSTSAFSA